MKKFYCDYCYNNPPAVKIAKEEVNTELQEDAVLTEPVEPEPTPKEPPTGTKPVPLFTPAAYYVGYQLVNKDAKGSDILHACNVEHAMLVATSAFKEQRELMAVFIGKLV